VKEFFAMGGYAFYVWMAYMMGAFLCIVEVIAVRARLRKARAIAAHRIDDGKSAARFTEAKQ
jgi:heme exporter protein CcmD